MKRLTVEKLVDHLTEGHLEIHGGYPYDWRWHCGDLIVAEIDHDGSSVIKIHTLAKLKRWVKEANRYAKEYESDPEYPGETCEVWEAVGETEPDETNTESCC